MPKTTFLLGVADELKELYSYSCNSNPNETLAETISHWFTQTLERDGFEVGEGHSNSVTFNILIDQDKYSIEVDGPDSTSHYADQLPLFLDIGKNALKTTEEVKLKPKEWPEGLEIPTENKMWDPQNTGTWFFFMPLGMAMLHQKVINFFHYPPLRLLKPMRDYLKDPVPVRLIELMMANGLKTEQEAWLYSTVMDCAPIAAPDDQGTQYIKKEGEQTISVHLLPIDEYEKYQIEQVEMLMNTSKSYAEHNIPIVVWGTSARRVFSDIYLDGKSLGKSKPTQIVINNKTTSVIGADHPYRFFAQAQSSDTTDVGLGYILPGKEAGVKDLMVDDLTVVRWQVLMGEDPTQDPYEVFKACSDYWTNRDEEREKQLNAIVQHQGSLYYASADSLEFSFKVE